MRILFVLPRMVSGGVERVTLSLAERFRSDGIECQLALRRCHGELLEEACSLMDVHELAPKGLHQFVPALTGLIKRWQPTHVITAFTDVAVLTGLAMRLARSNARLVHGVHNTHARVTARPGRLGAFRHLMENHLAGFLYRRADVVVAVSEGVREEVLRDYHISPSRVTTIYNPVIGDEHLNAFLRSPGAQGEMLRMVAVGRLTRQKGFDILIQALARMPIFRSWQLDIWGEGPERPHLESLIAKLEMQSRIRLCGFTPTPLTAMQEADLFLLPSRHEGLPTALIEALACQCQIVATDCPHGPYEILKGGQLGLLVPAEDPDALSEAILRAARREFEVAPELLRERARDFSVTTAYKRWLELLGSLH